MTTNVLKETVDALGYAFHEFKATNEERLEQLEQKNSVDPLITQKMERLNRSLDEAQDKITRLEAASKRPMMGSSADEGFTCDEVAHKNAFMNYIRKGADQDLLAFESKSLSTSPDKEGGYFIPSIISSHIHKTLKDGSSLRSLARVTEISTSALEMLIDKGDAAAGWAEEKGDRDETAAPEIAKVRIAVHEMYAKSRATQKLLEDSVINIEEWLAEKIASKMASIENTSFISGDGTGKPKGFLAYESVGANAWEWGKLEEIKTGKKGEFKDTKPEEDLIDLFHALKPAYLSQATWLMSRSAQSMVRKLKDPNNNHYLWQPALSLEIRPTLMGHPVHIMDDMPSLVKGTASKSLVFGNFAQGYQIVDRQGAYTLRDPYSAKPYVEFYTVRRVGGDVVNFEALKVMNFSD